MAMPFDFIVIGGGSGGLAAARRAVTYGAKVALVECDRLGGTCVIRGCVPKKVTYNLAAIYETVKHFPARYGFNSCERVPELDYAAFKRMRDAYVTRLNGIYHRNIERDGVVHYAGFARFKSPAGLPSEASLGIEILSVNGSVTAELRAPRVLIASGGKPHIPEDIAGAREHGLTSDGFFGLEEVPKHVVVVGAGYIAVEIGGILRALGSEVDIIVRGETLLRGFDESIQSELEKHMLRAGVRIHYSSRPKAVVKHTGENEIGKKVDQFDVEYEQQNGTIETTKQTSIKGCNAVIFATGRSPAIEGLQLPPQVRLSSQDHIEVDEFQNTGDARVFALGDVCGRAELTPVAIAAARHLANRLFGGAAYSQARLNYENIPTVVFSHPPIGTVGITEKEAHAKYPGQVRIYESTFINMIYSMAGPDQDSPAEKPTTLYKLVTVGLDEKVVGIHIIGHGSDEVIQGFAVALKMGALKSDLDNTIAIHPTAGEELVTMR